MTCRQAEGHRVDVTTLDAKASTRRDVPLTLTVRPRGAGISDLGFAQSGFMRRGTGESVESA